jgi:outer membrane protein OmpA-like peptidoglycan-associated protein
VAPAQPPVLQRKPKILAELDEEKMSEGQTIRIRNLYFKADSSNITSESYEVLDELASFLIYHPNVIIEIGGHTTTYVSPQYGIKLSEARAEAVAGYLIMKGVPNDQVAAKGYGKEKPIAREDKYNKKLRQKNQRVEIKVLSMTGEKQG